MPRLFQFVENVQFKRISLQLISWGPHSSLERDRGIHCLVFVFFIKTENRHFHVVYCMGMYTRAKAHRTISHIDGKKSATLWIPTIILNLWWIHGINNLYTKIYTCKVNWNYKNAYLSFYINQLAKVIITFIWNPCGL